MRGEKTSDIAGTIPILHDSLNFAGTPPRLRSVARLRAAAGYMGCGRLSPRGGQRLLCGWRPNTRQQQRQTRFHLTRQVQRVVTKDPEEQQSFKQRHQR